MVLENWSDALIALPRYLDRNQEVTEFEKDVHPFKKPEWIENSLFSAELSKNRYSQIQRVCWLIAGGFVTEAYLGGIFVKGKRLATALLLAPASGLVLLSMRLEHAVLVRQKAVALFTRISNSERDIIPQLNSDDEGTKAAARLVVQKWAREAQVLCDALGLMPKQPTSE